jgi:hypothetical protein
VAPGTSRPPSNPANKQTQTREDEDNERRAEGERRARLEAIKQKEELKRKEAEAKIEARATANLNYARKLLAERATKGYWHPAPPGNHR